MECGRNRLAHVLALVLFTAVSAGCGGGGGGGNVRNDPPPPAPAPTAPTPPPVLLPPRPDFTPEPPPPSNPGFDEINAFRRITRADGVVVAPPAGTAPVLIGFLDSGIDPQHPTLSGVYDGGITTVDPARSKLDVADATGHGSGVAHFAAGMTLGPATPAGIASPWAKVYSLRMLNDDRGAAGTPYRTDADFRQAFQAFADRGGRILNLTASGAWFEGPGGGPRRDDFASFIARDRLVVVPTGDGAGQSQPADLARLPFAGPTPDIALMRGWLVAGAVDTTGTALASYSRPCGAARTNCLMAVGNVVLPGATGSYQRAASTDYAAAQVSGAAALVRARYPYFSMDLVRQTLLGTATDLGTPGMDEVFGHGLLDVAKATFGPARFDFGDVSVTLPRDADTSWLNNISGAGSLTIDGGGKAKFALYGSNNTYTGKTTVRNGAWLYAAGGMASPVEMESGTLLDVVSGTWSGGVTLMQGSRAVVNTVSGPNAPVPPPLVFTGPVHNDGLLQLNRFPAFEGDFLQGENGTLAMHLESDSMHVDGRALLDGTLHLLGVKNSYVPTTRKVILSADGGITGTFDRLLISDSFTLDANLVYGTHEVWFDIARLDVHRYADAIGMSGTATASALRVEEAFDRIDGALAAGDAPDGTLLAGAAAIQQVNDGGALERTLSSLSGELHAADTALALGSLDESRRALETRADGLADGAHAGEWSQSLDGGRVWSGFSMDTRGWTMGRDARIGRVVAGVSLLSSEADMSHRLRADREHNRQFEAQAYATVPLGERGYLLGAAGVGHMQRDMTRLIDFDGFGQRVASEATQRYWASSMQAGWRHEVAGLALVPYVGATTLRLARDGFREEGAGGFGLSADASQMSLSQAFAGTRLARGWNLGATRLDVAGRLERTRTLSSSADAIDARFTGIDAHAPIPGLPNGADTTLFGLELGARWSSRSLLLETDVRDDGGERWSTAMLRFTAGF